MSIAKVAQKAGVSQATVSYVLNNKPGVSELTIKKVRQAMKELNYVPRASRSRDVTAQVVSRNIAVVFPEEAMSQSPLNMKLFEALHQQMENRSAKLMPIRLSKGNRINDAIDGRTMSSIDGMILLYYHSTQAIGGKLPFPIVTVLGHPDPLHPLACDHVEPDNARIGAMAAKYLSDKGHRQIVVIKPSTAYHPAMEIRCSTFVSAAETLNVKAEELHIPIELALSGHPDSLSKEHPLAGWIQKWMKKKRRPTGIFVPSDSHLAIVYNAMVRAGIEPEHDVHFIGCNNESILLQSLSPTPATIDINPEQMARAAFHMLLQRIAESGDAPGTHATVFVEPLLVAVSG